MEFLSSLETTKFGLGKPDRNTVYSSGFLVKGWASDKLNEISEIAIYINDKKLASIKEKSKRPQIAKDLPDYINSLNCGFECFVPQVSVGKASLVITATISSKEYQIFSKVFEAQPELTDEQISQKMKNDWNTRAENKPEDWVYNTKNDKGLYEEKANQQPLHVKEHLERSFPSEKISNQKMVEIGCGIGRLAPAFSKIFEDYVGVDVSEQMVNTAKENTGDIKNVEFFANNGFDLSMINNESKDFVFEGFVFQHIPQKNIVESYCKEAFRVLKNGGHFFALFWRDKLNSDDDKMSHRHKGEKIDVTNDTILGVQYNKNEITNLLSGLGFKDIQFIEDFYLDTRVHHIVIGTKD